MKVLLISAGNSVHTVRWANALTERGYQVYLTYIRGQENKAGDLSEQVKTIELPVAGFKGYYLNAFYLRKLIKRIEPDIVHAHYASGNGTLLRFSGVKNGILSVWGSDVYEFPYKNWLFKKIVCKNLKHAKYLVATSNCMAQQVCNLLGKNESITITPFGVDLDKFDGSVSKQRCRNEIVIGNVKTLKPIYGIEILIKAVALLVESLKTSENKGISDNIRCYIYGEGELRPQLENLIQDLGLERQVILKGYISHEKVPGALADMDIFCATSIQESFGVSLVEAQAMGLPVIASANDGFSEVIADKKTGLLVSVGDARETAKALEKLVLDKNLRKMMGEEGKKRVCELYDWKKNVNTLEELYKKVQKEGNFHEI